VQLLTVGLTETPTAQQAEQFRTVHAYLGLDYGHSPAVALDFDNFPALDNPVQDALSLVGHFGSRHNHGNKIPILAFEATENTPHDWTNRTLSMPDVRTPSKPDIPRKPRFEAEMRRKPENGVRI
jgi:hypothetical protein